MGLARRGKKRSVTGADSDDLTGLPGDLSAKSSDELLDNLPGNLSGRLSESLPDSLSKNLSENLSENLMEEFPSPEPLSHLSSDAVPNLPADSFIEEQEPTKFTARQKIVIFSTALLSFFLFFILFFPLESSVRYLLSDYFEGNQISYTNLDITLFGSSHVEGLQIAKDDISLKARELQADFSLWQLVGDSSQGVIYLTNVSFSAEKVDLFADVMRVEFLLEELDMPFSKWNGKVNIVVSGMQIFHLPFEGLQIIDLEKVKISNMDLKQVLRNGALRLDGSKVISNLFNISLDGKAEIKSDLESIQLDSRICLQPVEDLEVREPDIWGLYLLAVGEESQDRLCFDMNGPFSSPQFNKASTTVVGDEETL